MESQCVWVAWEHSGDRKSSQDATFTTREEAAAHLSCRNTEETLCVWESVYFSVFLGSNWQNLLSITKQEGWSHLTSQAWLTGPGDQSQSQTSLRPPGEQLSVSLQLHSGQNSAFQTILFLYFFNGCWTFYPSSTPASTHPSIRSFFTVLHPPKTFLHINECR